MRMSPLMTNPGLTTIRYNQGLAIFLHQSIQEGNSLIGTFRA